VVVPYMPVFSFRSGYYPRSLIKRPPGGSGIVFLFSLSCFLLGGRPGRCDPVVWFFWELPYYPLLPE